MRSSVGLMYGKFVGVVVVTVGVACCLDDDDEVGFLASKSLIVKLLTFLVLV